MEETPFAVEITNLSKNYTKSADSQALTNINLKIPLGQVVCLLGPNGSGKTTLLKILAGLVKPTSGEVNIMGLDAIHKPELAQAHIGWMPAEERVGFYGRLTGIQNLQFFATLNNIPDDTFGRVIGNLKLQLDIKNDLDKMVLKTSGGIKQKLGLLRALVHSPSVLLLDEPFRNLDPHTVQRFRRLLKDHVTRIQKKTVFLTTHLLEEARRISDVVVFLKDGKIEKELTARELGQELKDTSLEEYYLKIIKAEPK